MKREVLEGIVEITQKEFQDDRGSFMESFNSKQFNNSLKKNITFVQDNLSISKKGVFRGLHFQYEFPQAKLVSVLSGEILDIVVDLRKSSKTFGDWCTFEISSKNNKQIFIPEGFAHGFLALQDDTKVFYKVSDFWNPKDEFTLKYNDKKINIELPFEPILISEKDKNGLSFDEIPTFDIKL
jgi:dTDP-4-dehydrorhamnose 3,5-epimerase|tara:strand:- start:52 stop:597 length:546 start_codon:yes stop_codon:yes gene_type:complete